MTYRFLTRSSLLSYLALAWTVGMSQAMAQGYLPGDLDGDGRITTTDIGLLSSYLQGYQPLTDQQINAADVNGDRQITTADLVQLQQSSQVASTVPNSSVSLDSAFSGQVIDQQTGQPLSNVEVAVPEAGISVRTDSQGRFQLPNDIPANEILVARLENYLPFSQTTSSGDQPLQLQLERWDQNQTLVLETDVVRLGDNFYSSQSAAAGDFSTSAQGKEMNRTFDLSQIPNRSPLLRIGSLIGLDTPEAVRAGQTQIPLADMSPLTVHLNGSQIHAIALAGDNITVPLPIERLQLGTNTVTLRTGKTQHAGFNQGGGAQLPLDIPIFGGNLRISVPLDGNGRGQLDYDDIQLANVVIDL